MSSKLLLVTLVVFLCAANAQVITWAENNCIECTRKGHVFCPDFAAEETTEEESRRLQYYRRDVEYSHDGSGGLCLTHEFPYGNRWYCEHPVFNSLKCNPAKGKFTWLDVDLEEYPASKTYTVEAQSHHVVDIHNYFPGGIIFSAQEATPGVVIYHSDNYQKETRYWYEYNLCKRLSIHRGEDWYFYAVNGNLDKQGQFNVVTHGEAASFGMMLSFVATLLFAFLTL